MIKCDFCSEPVEESGARRFKAKTFIFMGVQSVGDWAGCPTCSNLIDTKANSELAWRCWLSMKCVAPLTLVVMLHELFRIHREVEGGGDNAARP